MSLFDKLDTGQNMTPQVQPRSLTREEAMRQLQSNPAAVLRHAGMNVPGDMRDPQQIVGYLLRTNQLGGNRNRQIVQLLTGMGRR